jgi:hypothetical protein
MQKYLFFTVLLILFFIAFFAKSQVPQNDTLYIPESKQIPAVDGLNNDEAWQAVEWKPISQIWMPYNNLPSNLGQEAGLQIWEGADDFTGKFKVLWSSETNLLYFIVEITDDVFTGGYVYNENPNSGGGYPNYDIVEVFIDEDRSGGLHVFDGTGSVATQWGTNAENAFSYHLAINKPEPVQAQTQFNALDISGTNWGYPNQKVANYAAHFPGFAVTIDGNKYIWEFSLKVYNDKYVNSNPEASRVTLQAGKVMGLSMAYCDNDNPNESPLRRDHFFGSVYVPPAVYNDHWKQANGYGVAKLAKSVSTSSYHPKINDQIKVNNKVVNGRLYTSVYSGISGIISIRIFNLFGQQVISKNAFKPAGDWSAGSEIQGLKSGIYLVETVHGNQRNTTKIVLP